MTTRSTETQVTFGHPFTLASFDRQQPPGTYSVVLDEEQIEGLSFEAYHRTAMTLYVPAISAGGGSQQAFPTSPEELEAALNADALKTLPDSASPQRQA